MIKKKYSNSFMTKNIIFTLVLTLSFVFYSANVSAAKPSAKKWTEQCGEDKKNCLALIQKNDDKKNTVAVIYIRMGEVTVDEKKQIAPVLFINLPLNQDLATKPKIVIDRDVEKSSLDANFTNCNSTTGCVANAILNDKGIELLKNGNQVSVLFKLFNNKEVLQMDFPLKGFTKAYTKILEK
tara:strand:+ start:903 stop:1448 length:546 start_codon:yes stop_codon:yes gene_type:complete